MERGFLRLLAEGDQARELVGQEIEGAAGCAGGCVQSGSLS